MPLVLRSTWYAVTVPLEAAQDRTTCPKALTVPPRLPGAVGGTMTVSGLLAGELPAAWWRRLHRSNSFRQRPRDRCSWA